VGDWFSFIVVRGRLEPRLNLISKDVATLLEVPMPLLQIDDTTQLAIEPYYAPEGQVAASGEDVIVHLDAMIAKAKSIASKVRTGLQDVGPNEVELELGFSAGKNIWVISAQGSIKLTLKWNAK